MALNALIAPLPLDERIPDLKKVTLINRAETFFIKGNVFYNLIDKHHAKRSIIQTAEAIESEPGFIIIKVNDELYDVARCYVPQEGQYENLSSILKSLLSEPIFESSTNPVFLSQELLEPSIIYGSVFNVSSGEPVMGAEIILDEPYKRRISDENGKFAFQVDQPGNYHVTMNPPPGYRYFNISRKFSQLSGAIKNFR